MTPRPTAKYPKTTVVTVRLSDDMVRDIRAVQARDGMPASEQIRRALRLWLPRRLQLGKTKGGV
jgi:Arc/MetJ-type ribon-helix-helix transcriptional regulator